MDPAARVRWAIRNSGRTLQDIAAAIGCSHATLSQWQTGVATIDHVKAGLLLRFAQETGTSLNWLLTGHGPAVTVYPSLADSEVVSVAREIAADYPELADTATRLLGALRSK